MQIGIGSKTGKAGSAWAGFFCCPYLRKWSSVVSKGAVSISFFSWYWDLTKFATIVSYTLSHAVRDRQS